MTEKSVPINIIIRVSERELKIEKEIRVEEMEGTIQGIALEAGVRMFGMGIKEIDERIAAKVPSGWQNVGTEERWIVSSIGPLRYRRRIFLDEKSQRRKPLDEVLGIERYGKVSTNTRNGIISGVYGDVPTGSQSAQLAEQIELRLDEKEKKNFVKFQDFLRSEKVNVVIEGKEINLTSFVCFGFF